MLVLEAPTVRRADFARPSPLAHGAHLKFLLALHIIRNGSVAAAASRYRPAAALGVLYIGLSSVRCSHAPRSRLSGVESKYDSKCFGLRPFDGPECFCQRRKGS